MSAIAFRPGQKFRFPDDDTDFWFEYIRFEGGVSIIGYRDGSDKYAEKSGYDLFDLIHV